MPLLVCPKCDVEMKTMNVQGVDIDICTSCQGVWLDKGELSKLQKNSQKKAKPNNENRVSNFFESLFNIFEEG